MSDIRQTRRTFMTAMVAVALIPGMPLRAATSETIHVIKDRNCGCCAAWIDVLRAKGFEVTTENSFGTLLMRAKTEAGIPQDMISCHTAKVAGYAIEGHVPPADIRLLSQRPDAIGLAVPGMPYGSPGWGRKTTEKPMTSTCSAGTARLRSFPATRRREFATENQEMGRFHRVGEACGAGDQLFQIVPAAACRDCLVQRDIVAPRRQQRGAEGEKGPQCVLHSRLGVHDPSIAQPLCMVVSRGMV